MHLHHLFSIALFLGSLAMCAGSCALTPPPSKTVVLTGLYVEPSGALVAETLPKAFFSSVDDGRSWTRLAEDDAKHPRCTAGLYGDQWRCVGVTRTVGAMDEVGKLYSCRGDHVAISADGGKHWDKTSSWQIGLPSNDACSVIAARGKTIYVLNGRMRKSVDGGAHWATGAPFLAKVNAIGLWIDSRGVLYASTRAVEGGHIHVYASTDQGGSWKRDTFGLPASSLVILQRRMQGTTLFFLAGEESDGRTDPDLMLYSRVDGQPARALGIKTKMGSWVDLQVSADALYVVTGETIFTSRNDGKTWRKLEPVGIERLPGK